VAAVTRMVSSSPVVSTAIWRLRPLTFLALSQPRLALGTVSAADGLGIDHRRGRLGFTVGGLAGQGSQLVVEPPQGPSPRQRAK
jgi:hypothetical protein